MVSLLVLLFLGVATSITAGVLHWKLDKWVEDHPRPINSICDMATPISAGRSGKSGNEQPTTTEEYTECYPSHVGRSIGVWHTVYGTGRSVNVSYEVLLENESDYPSYFLGSTTTAIPTTILVYTGDCDSNQLDRIYHNNSGYVTFLTEENELYHVHILGYGDSDAYSTQDFCVDFLFLDQ